MFFGCINNVNSGKKYFPFLFLLFMGIVCYIFSSYEGISSARIFIRPDTKSPKKMPDDEADERYKGLRNAAGALVRFPESRLAHRLLDGLKGLEIGASSHNPYGLDTWNVDFTDGFTIFKQAEIGTGNGMAKVHIVAPGVEKFFIFILFYY